MTRPFLIFLAIIILVSALVGTYFVGVSEGLGAAFFMAIGLRIISQFMKNEDIAIGVSEIKSTDSQYLRVLLLSLGVFLYGAGIFHLVRALQSVSV